MAQSISQSDNTSQINGDGPQRFSIEDVVLEKGMLEEAANEPVVVKVETRFSEKEVTIRQVAPMVIVLTGATFLVTIAAQAVIIILPEISRDLNIPQTRQQWVLSSYALTSGSFLLLWGKLGDVYGRKLLFILGALFTSATCIATAFSPVEICLYVMRALHGLASAITIPTAIGIIGHTIPPGRVKNYSFAFYSGGAPMGQVLGNLMGGIISQWASWKVVFFVIAGASLTIAVSAIFVVPKEPPKGNEEDTARASGVDWIGAFLFTAGLLLLLQEASVIAIIVISGCLLIVFVLWEHYRETKTTKEPLMKISTFRHKQFSIAMIIITLFSSGFTNFCLYTTYYYQDFHLLDPLQTALRYIPLGVVGILTTFGSGYLLARINGDYILSFGLGSAMIANLLFAVPIPPSTSYFAFGLPAMSLAAFGADTVYPCLGLFTTQSLPRKDQSVAGAMFQTMAAIGRSMPLPITSAIQQSVQSKELNKGATEMLAFLAGLRAVEWFCVGCMAASLAMTIIGLRNIGKIGMLKKLGVARDAKEDV
ncbi:putative drug resistance protein [Botrytis fragariae]|uniref:Putative drug resistance protein n=1 Tax=Botrytis fragariae TaxID=1964551 RepID=A0A8H6B409_9HELO|nr:putative drug resistance protein [Botrytis fragariae]KAF5878607.1 putative drug resistance protein [Botrytis fragariae]